MSNLVNLTIEQIDQRAIEVGLRYKDSNFLNVFGVPRGGITPAAIIARILGVPLTSQPSPGRTLVIDDLVDKGTTLQKYFDEGFTTDALYYKSHSPQNLAPNGLLKDGWLVFPWEVGSEIGPESAVERLLQWIGEDPTREGLLDTPKRVTKALREMTEGYREDPKEILGVTFDVAFDQMVTLKDIPFVSLCEHHMLPFEGKASVAYIPNGRVVGLSKLARVVDTFAKRLQVQERLTQEIAQAITDHVGGLGVGVIVKSRHTCMCYRGIKKDGVMVTSVTTGLMREDPRARMEFLALVGE